MATQQNISGTLTRYQAMRRIRSFEERALALGKEGLSAGSMHFCVGQEAIPVGACAALGQADRVVATYRGHGWALARGVPVERLLAEVCHRETGTNGGRGGSAYLSSSEHGFVGENSIVGAGVPIAAGVALASTLAGGEGVVVVSIGDGATSQGGTHEGLVLAASRKLPLIVVCEHNGWSEMTDTASIIPIADLSERAAGYGIAGASVDGCDPAAVEDAVREAAERARAGNGPTFLECKTVRLWGHYNNDIEHYRPKDERQAALERDPLTRLRAQLLDGGEVSEDELETLDAEVDEALDAAESFARESSLPSEATVREHVVGATEIHPPAVAVGDGGEETTYVKAVTAALASELEQRPELLVFGEDVGYAGGIFGATRGLQKRFGSERVFDTPIAETAMLGSAVGLAMEGARPVVEIMWADFLLVALDQLINQAANVRYLSRGEVTAPMVVRTQQGITPGSCAQHSQSLEALLTHVPGLRVGLPATPQDAYSMLRAAIADDDPCVVIESRALYQLKGGLVEEPDACAGGARLRRQGDAVTFLTWGRIANVVVEAAALLEGEGIEATVLDLRWLAPLDHDAIAAAVRSSGKVIVVHEANVTGGFGAELAAQIADRHFEELDAPVRRLGLPDVRVPASPVLQAALIPSAEKVAAAGRELAQDAL